jgi:hypothetical protein
MAAARVVVRIEDVTYQDAEALTLAEWVREGFEWRGGAIEFRIDAPDWDARRDVAVSARVETQGDRRSVYWNPEACPVKPGEYLKIRLAAG